ncbi:hypothetical protein Ga0100231_000860 [Opitutaceae bacterium TAV4]|nr:hypothetical protein Ga0100230_011890 [Opitutaceae bacterium TAV3]RRK01396.1 hypothetical protein Ga0100231_000860 [Opitutaceae bacterium TAV4]
MKTTGNKTESEEIGLERKDEDASSKKFKYRTGNPWLCNDNREEYEDCIAGNKEGLNALRNAIDEALEKGESRMSLHFSSFAGVVRVEGDPRETEPIQKNTFWGWVGAILYAVCGFALIGLVLGGGILFVLYLLKLARKFILE